MRAPGGPASGCAGETCASLGFWELLEYIVMEPPPALPAESFSPELCDFVASCLQKDAAARPSVTALAAHPFLAKHAAGPAAQQAAAAMAELLAAAPLPAGGRR
jgi:mitogen-activated protein kinase kinase 1